MTDPIVQVQDQNQNQNVQNVQNPQIPEVSTPVVDFDLNLPTNEENTTAEEPTISLDFDDIQKTNLDTPKETNVNDIAIEEATTVVEEVTPFVEEVAPIVEEVTPVIEEVTPVIEEATPVVEDNAIASDSEAVQLDETKDTNEETEQTETIQPETIETNPIDEIATEFSAPQKIEEISQQPENKEDNRLEQEDQLVEQEKQPIQEITPVIETKEEPEITSESLNIFEEKPEPGQPQQNFPSNTNLEQDHAIIAQLEASAGKPVENISTIPVAPTTTEVNLDDLFNTPTPQAQNSLPINAEVQNNNVQQILQQIPQQTPQQLPAFTGIQGFSLPPIAAQLAQQVKQPLNKKILINFGIGIIVFVVGWFMFKTMYPLEYQKIMGNWPEPTTIENQLTDNSTEITEETPANESDLFNNPALTNYHWSAPDLSWDAETEDNFNAFEDIEQNLTENNSELITKIQNYIDVWKKYTVIGKRNNDSEITKSSLFLYKKASTLLTDIENETQISTDELNKQLADLESYLQKLTWKNSDGEIVLQQPNTPTPEEFFWSENSWSTQEEPTTTEIPTTNESWTTTQETENAIENLSGDESPIIQSNDLNW
jgi:hypothetical protein